MLGKLWAGAILLSIALVGLQLAQGNVLAVQALVQEAFFAQAANAITISIALAGTLAFWMGMFALAESSGMAARIGQWIEPVLHRLMPSVPRGHEAYGPWG
jgi:spore maturation protein SpmA